MGSRAVAAGAARPGSGLPWEPGGELGIGMEPEHPQDQGDTVPDPAMLRGWSPRTVLQDGPTPLASQTRAVSGSARAVGLSLLPSLRLNRRAKSDPRVG